MLFNILITVKTLIYIYLTNIKNNWLLVLGITAGISMFLIHWLSASKNEKIRDRAKIIIYSLISILMFIDVLYYLQFNSLPSFELLGQAGQLGAVGDSIVHLLDFKNLALIIDLPFLLIFFKKIKGRGRLKSYPYLLIVLILFIYSGFTGKLESVKAQELYSYHFLDLRRSLKNDKRTKLIGHMTKEDLEDLKRRTNYKEGKLTGLAEGRDLIVIQVEALQNFVLERDYLGQEITPNLNNLLKDKSTIYYDRYYQLVGRGNTSDAEFVTNNSLHPAMEEPSYSRYEKNTFYGLPMLLKDQGYHTLALHGYEGDFWNRKNAYVNQGFEKFLDKEYYDKFPEDEKIGLGVSDRDFYKRSIDYLKDFKEKEDKPFYSFMISLTSHTPFKMPEKYHVLELEDKYEDTILGNYLQSVHYADKQLGFFIDYLKESGLYDNSLIAIYGDHFAINASKEADKALMEDFLGYYDYDEMMNIPLIIHLPGEEIHARVSKVGSQLDFYPTILNLLGYKNEKGLVFGRDLNNYEGENLVTPQTYMMKGSFISKDYTLVMARDGIYSNSRAYDIATRKKVDIEKLKPSHKRAIKEINMSNYITENDLLKTYMEKGDLDLSNNEGEEIIYFTRSNQPIKGLFKTRIYSVINLSKEKIDDDLLDNLPEDCIIQASKEDLLKNYRDSLKKNYVFMEDFRDYLDLTNKKYEKIILDPYIMGYSKEDIKSFIDKYPDLSLYLKEEDLDSYKDVNVRKFVER